MRRPRYNTRHGSKRNLDDYKITCATCGQRCDYSESVKLEKEVGLGNARVCPMCVDDIYWGSVPYVVPPDEIIPEAWPRPEDGGNAQILLQEKIVDPSKLDFKLIFSYNTPDKDSRLLNPQYNYSDPNIVKG